MMLRDPRSVSPIVGIVLMTLITVILATAIFKISNVYFQPAPNAILDVELYTVDNANATKIVVRDLGGDPIYFKNKRLFVYLNGHRFNFHPFTESGQLMAGDVGVMVVPFPSKVGQTVDVKLAIGGMSLFSGEWATVFYSKKVTVQKSRVLSVENGLLAEWHFEGFNSSYVNSNPPNKREVYDLSGNGNDLDIAGWNDLNTAWTEGINGMAYRFWSTSLGLLYLFSYYDDVVHVIDPGNSFTYEAWIRWEGETGWGKTIIYVGNNSTYDYKMWLFVGSSTSDSANLGYYVYTKSGRVGGYTGYMIKNGSWYYVVLTSDGSKIKLYVNGNLVNSSSLPAGTVKSDYVTAIGGAPGYPSFGGIIDEVYIWNRALTPQEIKERFEMYADKVGH